MTYYQHAGRRVRLHADPIKDPDGFYAEYCAARDGAAPPPVGIRGRSHAAGTWNAAIEAYLASSAYTTIADGTKKSYREPVRLLRETWGDLPMRGFKPHMIEALLDTKIAAGQYGAANLLLSVLRKVVAVAHKREWIVVDLVAGLKKQQPKNEGYRPYKPEEITRWREFYAIGSMPRLAFELVYNHALARADVIRVGPQHVEGGVLRIQRQKTGTWQIAPLTDPDLLACIAALPQDQGAVVDLAGRSTRPYLREASGDDFTADHFGAEWRKWARAAGLPDDFTIHGGRKTFARDAIDAGANELDAMKSTGHLDERVFRHYARTHDAVAGAERAAAKLSAKRRAG